MTGDAIARTTEQCELGEGARWDDRRAELLRVDILAGHVYRDTITDDGALVPFRFIMCPGRWGRLPPFTTMRAGCWQQIRDSATCILMATVRAIADVAPDWTRMNDAACDPQGRFWAGTLAHDQRPGGGALYRLDRRGQTELMLDGLTISNGLGWSPDDRTMYLVDTGPRVIHAFTFDPDQGTIARRAGAGRGSGRHRIAGRVDGGCGR